MEKINFPEGFADSKNGKSLSNSEINSYIKELIEKIESKRGSSYASVTTGNTIIFINKFNGYYDINVCKNCLTKKIQKEKK